MRTVSTKLDNKLHDQFMTLCNEDGKCQSEFLRDLIESVCDNLEDEEATTQDLEIDAEESEEKHLPITEGRIIGIMPSELTNVTIND